MPNIKRGMMGAAGVSDGDAGSLFAWGQGDAGATGQNNVISLSSPVQVGSLETWTGLGGYVTGTNGSVFAIKNDGTLWSWGPNNHGQQGHGDVVQRSSPVQVGSLTNWSTVGVDNGNAVFIKTDGTFWTVGANSSGQLGQEDGHPVSRSSPVQVGSLTDWSVAHIRYGVTRMIKTDGTLWMMGSNAHGSLGTNTTGTNMSSPVQVGTETDWTAITGGQYFSIGIRDGKLFGWGQNTFGQIADAVAVGSVAVSSPTQIGSITTWTHASSGNSTTVAISDGKLYAWGGNDYSGNTGLGTRTVTYSSPTQVGSLTDWTNIYCVPASSASIKANGTLWRWGSGEAGEIGIATAVNVSSPIQVGSETDWIKTMSGAKGSMGIR